MANAAELRQLVAHEFQKRVAASLEMLCGESVEIRAIELPKKEELVWHEFSLSTNPPAPLFIGAPALVSQAVGAIVLRAAGLEEMTEEDVLGSYHEVLQGALSAVAQAIGKLMGADLTIAPSREPVDPSRFSFNTAFSLSVADQMLEPIHIALSPALEALASEPAPQPATASTAEVFGRESGSRAEPAGTTGDGALDRIMDLDLPLRVSFGKAKVPLRNILKLTTGSIVELNRSILDPVEIIVNDRVVGRGEVVVIEGNYGVRIQELVSLKEG